MHESKLYWQSTLGFGSVTIIRYANIASRNSSENMIILFLSIFSGK